MGATQQLAFVVATSVMTNHLAGSLYDSLVSALFELVKNGMDAARRKSNSTVPKIAIDHKPGNTFTFVGRKRTLVICDNGCGMDAKGLQNYASVGTSLTGGKNQMGQFGVGKLACFAISTNKVYHLITTANESGPVQRFKIDAENLDKSISGQLMKREDVPGAPATGSFTMIIIENPDRSMTTEIVRNGLKTMMPLTEWELSVNGVAVERRQFVSLESTSFQNTEWGLVRAELRTTVEGGIGVGGIRIVDSGSGMQIASISALPNAASKLAPELLHSQVEGFVYLDSANVLASVSRSGFKANALSTKKGKALLAMLNGPIRDTAIKLVGEMELNANKASAAIRAVTEALSKAFGPPKGKATGTGEGKGEGAGSGDGKKKNRRTRRRRSGGGGGKGGGGGTPNRGILRDDAAPRVQIANTTYMILASVTPNMPTPVTIQGDNVMYVDATHRAFKVHLSPRQRAIALLNAMVWAHVLVGEGVSNMRAMLRQQQLIAQIHKNTKL